MQAPFGRDLRHCGRVSLNFIHFGLNDVILSKRPYIVFSKTRLEARGCVWGMIGKLFKFMLYLACLTFIGVVGYAYLGPWFGSDFSAPQTETRVPVTLDAD